MTTIPGPRRSTEQKPAPVPGQRTALGPRPAPPKQRLTARPLAHDLDWDHIPSAAFGTAA